MDQEISEIVSKIGNERDKLLPVMQEVVHRRRYLSEEAMRDIARSFKISPADVYGTATFYSFIDVSRLGRHVIRICKTICCDLAGKEAIVKSIERRLRINLGETTPDQKFTFLATNCIGWCHESPAMMIDDKVYTNLTAESALDALEEWD